VVSSDRPLNTGLLLSFLTPGCLKPKNIDSLFRIHTSDNLLIQKPAAPIKPPLQYSETLNGLDILRWFEHAFPIMHASAWGPLLRHGEIDVLDAGIVGLYFHAFKFLRRDRSKDQEKQGMIRRTKRQTKILGSRAKQALEDLATSRRSAPLEHADILFWPCEPTHVKAMLPVMRWLDEQQISSTVFACRAKVFRELEAHGVQAIFPNAHWGREIRQATRSGRKQGAKLRTANLFDLSDLRPFDNTTELVKMVRFQTAQQMPHVYATTVNTQEILRRIEPRVIVVGSDITFQGRIACRMAQAAGTPNACAMHGLVASNPTHALHIADRYLTYGNNAKQFLTSVGFPGERITVCGAPYLDDCPKQSGHINETIRKNLCLDNTKPYVLAATSGPGNSVSHEHHAQIIETLCRASIQLPHVQFVAKLHRKDHLAYYERVMSQVPNSKLSVTPYGAEGYPGDIFDWLQGCTVLLTGASSVATEAMLMDVPVITMDFVDEIGKIDFIAQGATTHVTTPDALIETIQAIVDSPEDAAAASNKSEAYLENMFLSHDGRSAERVGQELCRMAGLSN